MKIRILIVLILISSTIYSQDGTLDLGFGDEGKITTSFDEYGVEATSIVQQTDGKIILAGNGIDGTYEEIVVARYLPIGQLDSEFANDGKFNMSLSNIFTNCYGVAIDDNNNIFLGGYIWNADFDFKAIVIKLDMNGNIDLSFAENGIWQSEKPNTNEIIRSMLLQSDGKILLAGKINDNGNSCALIRLNPNGTLDMNFGTNGYSTKAVPSGYKPNFVKINNSGEIITGGLLINGGIHIVLAKFSQQGEIDNTFGDNGVMVDTRAIGEHAFSIAIQNDNKIIVSYASQDGSARDFGLVRYSNNGTLDNDFGVNGRVLTDFSVLTNTARSIVLQEDQKIIQSGFTGVSPNNNFSVVRFNSNGSLDLSFGDEGKTISDFDSDELSQLSILQSDGKLLCAGISRESTTDTASFLIASAPRTKYNTP